MSPNICPCCPCLAPVVVSDSEGASADGHETDDEVVNLEEVAVLGDKIVGTEIVTLDERGPGALKVQPLPSPQEPTPAERERHNVGGMSNMNVGAHLCRLPAIKRPPQFGPER